MEKFKSNVFYRVITSSFSDMEAETLITAKRLLYDFGETTNPNATDENKTYWAGEREKCRIVRVTELIEEISEEVSHG